MTQEIEIIDCNVTELQSEPFTENTEGSTETYTAKQLSLILSVSERSVYGYANRILEAWRWLPESEFRSNGIYTRRALEAMQELKSCKNASEYTSWVNHQALALILTCIGDGHDGIWNIVREFTPEIERREIQDLFHLMENLYKVGGSMERINTAKHHHWQGRVDDA